MMTLVHQSGSWNRYSEAGLLHRDLFCTPVYVANDVAFMCRHPKLIKYYTDLHDVDEESVTISSQGGRWEERNWAGVTFRIMGNGLATYIEYVAPKCRHPENDQILYGFA